MDPDRPVTEGSVDIASVVGFVGVPCRRIHHYSSPNSLNAAPMRIASAPMTVAIGGIGTNSRPTPASSNSVDFRTMRAHSRGVQLCMSQAG